MKERYRNMMEKMKLSEAGRIAIEEKTAEKPNAVGRKFPRLGLAAACVCLILVGGVLAAGRLGGGSVRLSGTMSGEEYSGYQISVDLTQEDEKIFSEKLVDDLNNGTLQRGFMDRTELETYLGFPLIHSAMLENAPINEHLEEDFAHNWNLRPELAVAPDARYVLTATTYDDAEMTGLPEVLKISVHRVVENFEVYIDARIITGGVDGQVDLMGEEFAPEPLLDHKLLVDENGYLVLDENGNAIMETIQYKSAEKIFSYESYLMANGLEATIVTIETPEPSLERAKEAGIPVSGSGACDYIAYFVYDGVLYSVMPWAIYDNTIPGNYVNGRALMILKHILDSFA